MRAWLTLIVLVLAATLPARAQNDIVERGDVLATSLCDWLADQERRESLTLRTLGTDRGSIHLLINPDLAGERGVVTEGMIGMKGQVAPPREAVVDLVQVVRQTTTESETRLSNVLEDQLTDWIETMMGQVRVFSGTRLKTLVRGKPKDDATMMILAADVRLSGMTEADDASKVIEDGLQVHLSLELYRLDLDLGSGFDAEAEPMQLQLLWSDEGVGGAEGSGGGEALFRRGLRGALMEGGLTQSLWANPRLLDRQWTTGWEEHEPAIPMTPALTAAVGGDDR